MNDQRKPCYTFFCAKLAKLVEKIDFSHCLQGIYDFSLLVKDGESWRISKHDDFVQQTRGFYERTFYSAVARLYFDGLLSRLAVGEQCP